MFKVCQQFPVGYHCDCTIRHTRHVQPQRAANEIPWNLIFEKKNWKSISSEPLQGLMITSQEKKEQKEEEGQEFFVGPVSWPCRQVKTHQGATASFP